MAFSIFLLAIVLLGIVMYLIQRNSARLPFIFALDALLEIPNGFVYSLNCRDNNAANSAYCAGDIGCGGGCGGSSGSDTGDSGCGGGCGGD